MYFLIFRRRIWSENAGEHSRAGAWRHHPKMGAGPDRFCWVFFYLKKMAILQKN